MYLWTCLKKLAHICVKATFWYAHCAIKKYLKVQERVTHRPHYAPVQLKAIYVENVCTGACNHSKVKKTKEVQIKIFKSQKLKNHNAEKWEMNKFLDAQVKLTYTRIVKDIPRSVEQHESLQQRRCWYQVNQWNIQHVP